MEHFHFPLKAVATKDANRFSYDDGYSGTTFHGYNTADYLVFELNTIYVYGQKSKMLKVKSVCILQNNNIKSKVKSSQEL